MITRILRPTKDIHSGESTTIRVELYSLGNQLANTEIEPRTETVVQTVYHDHGTAIDLWDGTTLVLLRQHAWPKVGRSARSDRFFFSVCIPIPRVRASRRVHGVHRVRKHDLCQLPCLSRTGRRARMNSDCWLPVRRREIFFSEPLRTLAVAFREKRTVRIDRKRSRARGSNVNFRRGVIDDRY